MMKSEKDLTEDIHNEPEEKLSEEPSDDSVSQQSSESDNEETEQSSEELKEEPTQDTSEKHVSQLSSDVKNDLTEQESEEPDEGPLEESWSQPLSESNSDDNKCHTEPVLNNSNEKKRLLDVTAGDLGSLQVHPSRKKCKQEECIEPETVIGSTLTDLHNESGSPKEFANAENSSEQQDCTGSSGKLRRSRDPQPEVGGEEGEGERTSKRRKIRWVDEDSQLKLMGPIQLPDFIHDIVTGADSDPEIQELKKKLLETNRKLQESEIHCDWPKEERSPSSPPVYDQLGIRMNSRDISYREKLIQDRQTIILKLIQKNPMFKPPSNFKPSKLYKKLYIPLREYPGHNFIGLIIGPRGNTQKRMEKETGARIVIRGKGSAIRKRAYQKPDPIDNDDLHVLIEADNQGSLDAAVKMVEKLLNPVDERINKHKLSQLKELAALKGMQRDESLCKECGERGRKQYACPSRKSNFEIDLCNICRGSRHPSTNCPLAASTPVRSIDHQHHSFDIGSDGLNFSTSAVPGIIELDSNCRWFTSPSYGHFSHPGVSPAPTIGSCEQGHKQYACPCRKPTFEIDLCNKCRGSGHPSTNCPLAASTPVSNIDHQHHSSCDIGSGGLNFGSSVVSGIIEMGHSNRRWLTSPSYGHFSYPGVSPAPNTRSCERGHKQYACPCQKPTFEIDLCNICRGGRHPSTNCPLAASTPVSNIDHQHHGFSDIGSGGLNFGTSVVSGIIELEHSNSRLFTSPPYGHFSHPGVSPTPNTRSKCCKEIDDTNIYVGYLPHALDDNQLRDLFSPFGMITAAKVMKDRSTGLSKGYGFVRYVDPTNAVTAAAHMQGQKIDGKTLVVRVLRRFPKVGFSGISCFESTQDLTSGSR
ncbi:splicing factor-like protein 1 [Macadamia integrifolia]|uniref:splicing factor-like protein 1 n=1 Tax=Macadamia integrifolia TaxID=60698 RepID=UPI001C4E44B4|nr:splicing factor-like protein 1 [Macadamia integrifolia]